MSKICTACQTYPAIEGYHQCESCKKLFKEVILPSMENKIVEIRFRGIDDWHRAVFKDVNSNTYYGDCNCNKTGKPEDVISYYKENIHLLEYFGTHFNCEPNGGLNPNTKLNII